MVKRSNGHEPFAPSRFPHLPVGRDRWVRRSRLVCWHAFRQHTAVAHELKSAFAEFVRFAQTLRGDEKSEAQTFLDHFFRALGHEGVIEAGATFEFRVAKKPGSPQLELVVAGIADPGHRPKGGKKFADLLWPDRVLIEMKSRGENLEKHYDQAFDYWTHIVPKRPPFVILCNFDEFWIYDFNAQLLHTNVAASRVYNGQFPRHSGFVVDPTIAGDLIRQNSRNREVVHPFLIGREMLVEGEPQRFVIDFEKRDLFEAQKYREPFEQVRAHVLPHVEELARKEREKTGKDTGQNQLWLKTWWQLFRSRKELIDKISKLSRYMVCSEVTKRPIFSFVDPEIRPDHTLEAFVFEDDYSFGILQSGIHWSWFITTCSKLKGDFRYTPESVFDTFAWPQQPTRAQIKAVAEMAVALRALRRETMRKLNYSLRDLYRTLDQPGDNPLRDVHARLDAAVRAAYGMPQNADPLAFLLKLNLACCRQRKSRRENHAAGFTAAARGAGCVYY